MKSRHVALKVLLANDRAAGAFHMFGAVELSQHLPQFTSGGMKATACMLHTRQTERLEFM